MAVVAGFERLGRVGERSVLEEDVQDAQEDDEDGDPQCGLWFCVS